MASLTAQVIDPSRRQEATLSRTPGPSLADSAALDQRTLEEENAFAPSSLGDDDIGQPLILKEVQSARHALPNSTILCQQGVLIQYY